MNIFTVATEFVDLDNRRFRTSNICSAQSLHNKFQVQLDPRLIENKTILDLGSCLGAGGHWALSHGAQHYTGVELQDYYADTSCDILNKHWPQSKFDIVKTNIESFLDNCIATDQTYDYVLAAGILQGFFDTVGILKKIAAVTKETLVIDTINLKETKPNNGFILFKNVSMVRAGVDVTDSYNGLAANVNLSALDMIMSVNSFKRTEDKLQPLHHGGIDPYNDIVRLEDGSMGAWRYVVRYTKTTITTSTLETIVINNDTSHTIGFDKIAEAQIPKWDFNSSIADRFQQEAVCHIPDYQRVVDLCVNVAKRELASTDAIIDVGSALGHTLDALHTNGFINIAGVESSKEMIAKSRHSNVVVCSDVFPSQHYQLVLINWTLHFIKDKQSYLTKVHSQLNDNGLLILTDKTVQSPVVKDMYYQFKRNNGVDQAYIEYKEKQLEGYMHVESANWYMNYLPTVFSTVEILNSNLGFVTYLCRK
jgi:2-polyprenyl-3-methyl-5-hydroxy-6-metoxy-1,4-benzoquinol methylase